MNANGADTNVKPGRLIVIEGADGSGKSTLAKEFAAACAAEFVDKKTVVGATDHVVEVMDQIREQMWAVRDPSSKQFFALFPDTYWIHLQATWYTLFTEFVLRPQLDRGVSVVVDGWIYKFMAKLFAKGVDREYLKVVLSGVRRPDAVILLQVDAADVWHRSIASRREFNEHEMGALNGFKTLGEASFVSHQSDVARELARMAREEGWRVIDVGADESAATTGARLRELAGAARWT